MTVWIAQCLCPQRHCIVAAAGEADSVRVAAAKIDAPLRVEIANLLQSGDINPWCGLCKAPSSLWRYELARSRFATLEEAAPHLQRLEDEMTLTRRLLGDHGKS